MKVRIVNPANAPGLRDPLTRRAPFLADDGSVVLEAEVPDSPFWRRRIAAGEVAVLAVASVDGAPDGSEPLAPLTTRTGRR